MNTALSRRQPNKPIRDGIQCYSVAESKGKWCYVSWIDCGKLDNAFKGPYAHGWICDMVLHVLLNLGLSIIDKYHIIAFDQYFSSPILFALLFNIGIYAVGTCQTNRRGFPQRILSGKYKQMYGADRVTLNLGEANHAFMTGMHVSAVRWMDKKDVWLLSNYHYSPIMRDYESKKKAKSTQY